MEVGDQSMEAGPVRPYSLNAEEGDTALQAVQTALEAAQSGLIQVITKLSDLAVTDLLTGLNNRRAFQERLVEEVARATRYGTLLSLLVMDMDEFGKRNNLPEMTAGGDMILKSTADLLRRHSRETDFIARCGGDEFAMLLPSTSEAGAILFAERLRVTIEDTQQPGRSATASFGVATLPSLPPEAQPGTSTLHQERAAALHEAAQQALQRSKTSGRNRVTHALNSME